MNFLDLFSGIGGFRFGLENAGHKCIGFCEIDKYARASYKAIHNTEGEKEYHDITSITNEQWRELVGSIDIIAGGFPCQAFSIAGKRKGFEDETRGTLFFEIMRAAQQIKPSILLLENVKGLLNHDGGRTFGIILQSLDELGYDAEWQVLNSKDFGVPQNRERVFIIAHLRNGSSRSIFPISGADGENNISMNVVAKWGNFGQSRVFSEDGIVSTCLAQEYKDPKRVMIREATKQGYAIASEGNSINFEQPNSKTRRGRVGKEIANTLTTSCSQGVLEEYRIRKLTPKECWRLQGFPDWAFEKAEQVNSNSQLYKQAGNSVTVSVVEAIGRLLQ